MSAEALIGGSIHRLPVIRCSVLVRHRDSVATQRRVLHGGSRDIPAHWRRPTIWRWPVFCCVVEAVVHEAWMGRARDSAAGRDAAFERARAAEALSPRNRFQGLMERHEARLRRLAYGMLADKSRVDDVLQDAFIRVVQNAADFKHEARFSTWLYTIARNLCIDQIRKRALRRHPSLDEPRRSEESDGPTLGEQTADSRANVERTAVAGEIRERVLAAVDELPEEQREVFLMREVSNLPFKEIAEIVGVPENTVKSRMRYALERLQAALSDFEEYARALR